MKFNEVLKDIDLKFSKHKNEDLGLTYCIDHKKSLTSFDVVKVEQYEEGAFAVCVYDPSRGENSIVYKKFKTLQGAKQFIIKMVQDEQQRTYQDLVFHKAIEV